MRALAGSTDLVCGTCGQRAPQGYAGPTGIDEAKARDRREGDRILRNMGVPPFVVGIVFLAFAVGCWIVTAVAAAAALSGDSTDFRTLVFGALFGLLWAVLGGVLVFVGARTLRQLALRKRLRTYGVRGFGTVLEWEESGAAASTVYKMKLNVAVTGQHPYVVRVREMAFIQTVYTNLTLPVLVDPANARNVVVDWDGPRSL